MRALAVRVLAAILLSTALCGRAQAATPKIHSFTNLCGATTAISFTVTDDTQTRMPGSATCSFSLDITTGPNQGSVTLTAPSITGSTGVIPGNAFWASCSATSDPSAIFTTLGTVQLGSSAVSCATIAANTNNKTVTFVVTLYLDDTPDATAFPGDPAYVSAKLAVTANAP